jgi:hypothetical protein
MKCSGWIERDERCGREATAFWYRRGLSIHVQGYCAECSTADRIGIDNDRGWFGPVGKDDLDAVAVHES